MKTVISRKLTHAKKEENGPSTEGCRPEHIRRTVRGTSQDSAGEGRINTRTGCGICRCRYTNDILLGIWAHITTNKTLAAISGIFRRRNQDAHGTKIILKNFVKTVLTNYFNSCRISFATLELANISYRRSRFPVVSSVATCGRSRLFFIYTT